MKDEKDVQVVHALPGRVRLKLSRLKNNIAYADEIQGALLKVSGITHLEANPKTGSLLIEYDSNVLEVLSLHSSVSSCLGSTRSDLQPQSRKDLTPAKDPVKTLKPSGKVSPKKVSPKIEEKAKPKKKSSKKTKAS